ncbi:SurA N-terminal domain-containing protein [Propionivibrio sp.]|uniref:SurA N-terminal domain-containing protein n=1 Tax=Propionivibrio sp. TaxID=2212460 RepID=UPI0025F21291|nr:SurA N-terminal domain-containing protein [Propionivibrio sp.]MBK8744547.1 SurA N-terminal domain-containing protein [Propionivibrio sp.]MBK8894947.1 SurA N-terminal domain-containing protein [Propionivibrio sp.]
MFDSVRNNKKIVQIFLALITLPFAFFGVDSYVRNVGAGSDLASVGDTKITIPQFELALREHQDQLRQKLGASFKLEMMNSPEVRQGVLEALIDRRLLLLEVEKHRLLTSDNALREAISKIPALQEDGQFSMARYESALRAQGMSQPMFEARVRQDLTIQQLIGAVGDTAMVADVQAQSLLRLQTEERQFSEFRIAPEQFADKVKVETATIQKYYEDNPTLFQLPEQVRAEFLVLSLDEMLAQVTVDEGEIKAWYEGHKDRYQQPEERRASHILITADKESEKAKAKAKAESVLQEVQKSPAQFAELAKKYSQDPGSAQKGGDLGYFGRGMMVKAFEDTVFKQKEGDISGLVESEFGYHIIKLTGIKPGTQRPFNTVRPEIEGELKRQAATRKFAEAAEAFNNMVYEQSDSLQPAADKFKLKIQRSGWVTRNPDPKAMAALGQLANVKIVEALFSDDAVKNKRNTEAVEIAPNTLLAARVLDHVPASKKPFESVKADIEKLLKSQEAAAMARSSGEAKLAELKNGDADKLAWSLVRSVSRAQRSDIPVVALQTLFKADVQKLPSYVGAWVGGSYMLYKIVKVSQPDSVEVAKRQQLQREYTTIVAQEDLSAFLVGLRSRYKIDINKAALEPKERQ